MSWIIGILTFILVADCLLMALLILVQLPKKEAGMGTAFGAGATDALFGAGTGNALTKLTKYTASIFFVLTLGLSILNAHQSKSKQSKLEQELNTLQQTPAAAVAPPVLDTNQPSIPPAPTAPPTNTATTSTNPFSISLPQTQPAAPASTTPPPPEPTVPTPAPAPAPADTPPPNNPNP